MDLKKAKSMVDEILSLCSKLEYEELSTACNGIYNDLQVCKTIHSVISCARELMVFSADAPWDEETYELHDEVEIIFNQLLDDTEEY